MIPPDDYPPRSCNHGDWWPRQLRGLAALLVLICASSSFAAEKTTVQFDSGGRVVYSDAALSVPLSPGSPANSDGTIVQIGYYDQATPSDQFNGAWVPLTGAGSANTAFESTSIGDGSVNGTGAGTVWLSLVFVAGSASKGNDLPPPGTPLAVRFYNAVTLTAATKFNAVSSANWLWAAPKPAPGHPALTLSLNDPNLVWLGGNSSAFATNQAVASGSIAFSAAQLTSPSANANGSPNNLVVTLARTNGTSGTVSVDVALAGGSLNAGSDFSFTNPTTLIFGDGVASRSFSIPLASVGSVGTIQLLLGNPVGGVILGASSATTINVQPPSAGTLNFTASSYPKVVKSGVDSNVTIAVRRSGGSYGAVSAQVAVTGGAATLGSDFTLPGSPPVLSWGAGDLADQSFELTLKGDAQIALAGETIVLTLQNVTGNASVGPQASTTVRIYGQDSSVPTLTFSRPGANSTVSGNSVTLSGKATDDTGITKVEVSLNGGAPQSTDLVGDGTAVDWSLTLLPEQGLNTVQVTSYDSENHPSVVVTRKFTFAHVRPQLAGRYNGLLVADSAAARPTEQNGLIALTVGSAGAFTGKVTLNGVTRAISGVFQNNGTAIFRSTKSASMQLIKPASPIDLLLGYLSLALDVGGGHQISGQLREGEDPGSPLCAALIADQALYSAKSLPVAPMLNVPQSVLDLTREKGFYTAIFQPVSENPTTGENSGIAKSGFPQGSGYASVRVSRAGGVKLTGKLADGSAISYSNQLSSKNQWPVFIQLYSKRGYLTGMVQFDGSQAQTDASGLGMKWFKPRGLLTPKLYFGGWPNGILTDFLASKFIPSSHTLTSVNTGTVLGSQLTGASSSAIANVQILTFDGGLLFPTSNDGSLSPTNRLTILGPSSGSIAASSLQASFSPLTGKLTGTFIHPLTGKSVALAGMTLQKTTSAGGFFLFFPPSSLPNLSAQSGQVDVVGK